MTEGPANHDETLIYVHRVHRTVGSTAHGLQELRLVAAAGGSALDPAIPSNPCGICRATQTDSTALTLDTGTSHIVELENVIDEQWLRSLAATCRAKAASDEDTAHDRGHSPHWAIKLHFHVLGGQSRRLGFV